MSSLIYRISKKSVYVSCDLPGCLWKSLSCLSHRFPLTVAGLSIKSLELRKMNSEIKNKMNRPILASTLVS